MTMYSGVSGAELWQRDSREFNPVPALGDLNGRDDIIERRFTDNSQIIGDISGATGTTVWEAAALGSDTLDPLSAAHVSSSDHADVLESGAFSDGQGNYHPFTSVLDGAGGRRERLRTPPDLV